MVPSTVEVPYTTAVNPQNDYRTDSNSSAHYYKFREPDFLKFCHYYSRVHYYLRVHYYIIQMRLLIFLFLIIKLLKTVK